MNKLLIFSLLLSAIALAGLAEPASAQLFEKRFTWSDTLQAGTTAVDSAFVVEWKEVVLKPDTNTVYFRFGAPDTTNWSSRDWIKLKAGESFSFGPATPLRRLEWKTTAGVDVITLIGTKKSAQHGS